MLGSEPAYCTAVLINKQKGFSDNDLTKPTNFSVYLLIYFYKREPPRQQRADRPD